MQCADTEKGSEQSPRAANSKGRVAGLYLCNLLVSAAVSMFNLLLSCIILNVLHCQGTHPREQFRITESLTA